MRAADVREGLECWTYVSGTRVRVRVLRAEVRLERGYRSGDRRVTRYRLVRCDTGAPLPKARTAAALHPVSPREESPP